MSFEKNFFDLLNSDEFSGINLTRINSFDEFCVKQVEDSLAPLEHCPIFKEKLHEKAILLDIGFGGGFPILPLANSLKNVKFVGFEARRKKAVTVSQIAKKLKLENVSFFHYRIEEIFIDLPCVLTFKAVGKVNDFLERINSNTSVAVYFYKAKNFFELEAEQLLKAKEKWRIIEKVEIDIKGNHRVLIGFENLIKTNRVGSDKVKLSKIVGS